MDFTDLVTKYKSILLDTPEVVILSIGLGCIVTWFLVHTRVGNAKAEVESKKAEIESQKAVIASKEAEIGVLERHVTMNREHAEHYKARIDALEIQNLRTYTPPEFEKKG